MWLQGRFSGQPSISWDNNRPTRNLLWQWWGLCQQFRFQSPRNGCSVGSVAPRQFSPQRHVSKAKGIEDKTQKDIELPCLHRRSAHQKVSLSVTSSCGVSNAKPCIKAFEPTNDCKMRQFHCYYVFYLACARHAPMGLWTACNVSFRFWNFGQAALADSVCWSNHTASSSSSLGLLNKLLTESGCKPVVLQSR